MARAAEVQAKSASSSANGAAPAPSFTGATDPA
jgi:hypothetical protein